MLKVFKDGVLIDVHVSYWSGGKALSAEDLGLKETEVADAFKLGKKMLVPDEIIKKFRAKEAMARRIVEINSFPFPIGHASFVPKKKVDKVIDELIKYKADYNALVEELVTNYDQYRQEMAPIYKEAAKTAYAKSLAGQTAPKEFTIESLQAEEDNFVKTFMERIASFYPPVESLKAKFSLDWDEYVITTPQLDKAEEAKAAYRKSMDDSMSKFVSEVVTSLRSKTIEMCSRLADNIKTGKVVRTNSLEAIRKFINEYKELNFVGDIKVEEQLESLKTYLNVDSVTFNESKDLQEAMGRKLTEIIDSAAEISDISAITGQYKRKIDLD